MKLIYFKAMISVNCERSLGIAYMCCGVGQQVSDSEVRKIVLSYLVHNCFKETAETFIACSGMKRTADCSVDIDKRKRMFLAKRIFSCLFRYCCDL